MKITAIAKEDLKEKGLDLLPNEIGLEIPDNAIPDSYGEHIGRYDIESQKYESFFKKDHEAGDTKIFDAYREKCGCIKEKRNSIYTEKEIKDVLDYYVMYDIKESSKNLPTELEEHVDRGYCINGNYKCKYELVFACDGMVSRVVVNYTANNIPMYDFVKDLEDDIADALEDDSDEDNIFYGIIKDSAIIMRDEFGAGSSIEIETADDLTAMLVSVRLLSCEFVRREK